MAGLYKVVKRASVRGTPDSSAKPTRVIPKREEVIVTEIVDDINGNLKFAKIGHNEYVKLVTSRGRDLLEKMSDLEGEELTEEEEAKLEAELEELEAEPEAEPEPAGALTEEEILEKLDAELETDPVISAQSAQLDEVSRALRLGINDDDSAERKELEAIEAELERGAQRGGKRRKTHNRKKIIKTRKTQKKKFNKRKTQNKKSKKKRRNKTKRR